VPTPSIIFCSSDAVGFSLSPVYTFFLIVTNLCDLFLHITFYFFLFNLILLFFQNQVDIRHSVLCGLCLINNIMLIYHRIGSFFLVPYFTSL
jgi:hypothetical protein